MNNRELLNKIYYLREKSELNKLVVFVGAGVSCNVDGMPSWHDLIVKMAKTIDYSKRKILHLKQIRHFSKISVISLQKMLYYE